MANVVRYDRREVISNASAGSGSGGGDVEDILKRLGNVESHVSELRSQVSAIGAIIPHLATKADVSDVRAAVGQVGADLAASVGQVKADLAASVGQVKGDLAASVGQVKGDLAASVGQVKGDLAASVGQLKADVAAVETAIIKWIVATVLASAALAFAIAKFVH
jgi:hypothetical protein